MKPSQLKQIIREEIQKVLNEKLTDEYFNSEYLFKNSNLTPPQIGALVNGFRGSLDALIKVVEELKSEDPIWDEELRFLGAVKDMQSKSQLFRNFDRGSWDANTWNSAYTFAMRNLPFNKTRK